MLSPSAAGHVAWLSRPAGFGASITDVDCFQAVRAGLQPSLPPATSALPASLSSIATLAHRHQQALPAFPHEEWGGAAVKAVCSEYRIHNADVHMRDDCDIDELVDVIEGSRVYIPAIYVINKIDQITLEELQVISR